MKFTKAAVALFTVSILAVACSSDAKTEDPMATKTSTGDSTSSMSAGQADRASLALVRFVNAVPASASLIVRADSAHVMPGVAYKEVTPFQALDKTWVKFEVGGMNNGPFMALATNREMLMDGNRYTMILMRDKAGTGYDTRVLKDNISSDSMQAHLRIVHAAAGFETVNVSAKGGASLMDGVSFQTESSFKDVIPWTGTVEIRSDKGKQVLLSIPNVALTAGSANTIVLTRTAAGKVESFWFVDKPMH